MQSCMGIKQRTEKNCGVSAKEHDPCQHRRTEQKPFRAQQGTVREEGQMAEKKPVART